jgi:methyl-accepting chemotaxis protein
MNLRRLGLKQKLAIGSGSLLAIIGMMGWIGFRTAGVNERLAHEVQLYSSLKDNVRTVEQAVLIQRIGARDVMMGRDKENTKLYERGEADFLQAIGDLKPLLPTDVSRDLCAKVETAGLNYMQRNDRLVALYRGGSEADAAELFKGHDGLLLSNDLTASMNNLMAEFEQRRQAALDRQIASDGSSKTLMLILALTGLAIGGTIATVIARSILLTIDKMLTMIETVSSNNLAADDMAVESDDGMGKAALGLNMMKNGLREVILSIASTAEEVSHSSREISATAAQAANRAEDQKHQVKQIAATMQEMADTVRAVSLHSNTAAESAKSAATSARDGGRIVEGVLERMHGIAQSVGESAANIEHLRARSDEIGRIVGMIGDIANQTNLLALNAAIEAARAGEQGRGFAVVAGEVRRLAERTAVATKEIAAVIRAVQSLTVDAVRQMHSGTAAVEQGVEITAKAGESIQRIIREADKVGLMVAQIASTATQQAAATEEVTTTMHQISELAADSADGAQHSASTCEQLSNLALGLQNMVDRFELGERATRPAGSGRTGSSVDRVAMADATFRASWQKTPRMIPERDAV